MPARALEVTRGFVRVAGAGGEWLAPVPGTLRRSPPPWSQVGPPATGDWLAVEPGGAVRGILPRRSSLRRFDETAGHEVLVANADLAVIVASLNADFNLARIERLLSIADDAGAPRILALSKSDLVDDPDAVVREAERGLGVTALGFSSRTGAGVEALMGFLRPCRTSVLIGSSGVGKSTLVNRLLGRDERRTLDIREHDAKGRHATTSRTLLELPGGALVVDTPGLRSPRPAGPAGLRTTFADVFSAAAECRFGDCRHQGEPGCGVRVAVESGELPARRPEALRKLERELAMAASAIAPGTDSRRRPGGRRPA